MRIKKKIRILKWIFPVLFLMVMLWEINPAWADLTIGKTYDKTNYQEIQDFLIQPVLNWVKKGEFILDIGQLEYEFKSSDPYIQASQKNEGLYDVDKDGILIEKNTGKATKFYYGDPFPKVDTKDPKAGEKIMENNAAKRFHQAGFNSTGRVSWVGKGGLERQVIAAGDYFNYMNRRGGPLPNPDSFLNLQKIFVVEPFDLRGTVQMSWTYNDEREDTAFAYIPMLRRVRRVSAVNRSDPFLGSDFCTDDAYTWVGKNAAMKWKLIGEKKILLPFVSPKKIMTRKLPDGTIERAFYTYKIGYQVPGWKGAPWAPVGFAWHPRDCWVVEGMPKDPYYNYGKQIFYVDKISYVSFFKEVYDKAGLYWKTVFIACGFQETQDGDNTVGMTDFYMAIDDKTHHASTAELIPYQGRETGMNLPTSKLGRQDFTEAALFKLTK